jgi:predicted SAM-dependent methyltransferase
VLGVIKHNIRLALNAAGIDIRRINPQRVRVRKELLSGKFKNYNIGCGPFFAEEFLNIDCDLAPYLKIGRIPQGTPIAIASKKKSYVMSYDVREGIPAGDNSVEIIYHCHFLEHLSNDDGYFFLSECFRSLIPGGVMHFALPDMELWCRNYTSGNSEFFDWYRQTNLHSHYPSQRNETNGMVFSANHYNWGHRMAYDFDSLSVRLTQIGFVDIRRVAWGDSRAVPHISFLEPADSDYIRESLVVECRKSSVNAENKRNSVMPG